MKITKHVLLLILVVTFPLHLSSAQEVEKSSIKTSVIFNTLCAKCHEGECSGRLSFHTGSKAASSHIKRYAGDINISKAETEEFFSLLNYMKIECAMWMPENKVWKLENLSTFALPSSKGYFIPLGLLKEGKYYLEVKLKDDSHFRLEVLSDHLEHYIDISVCPSRKEKIFEFTLKKSVNIFLRLQSRQVLEIRNLKINKNKKSQ